MTRHYPLLWPDGLPRTAKPQRSKFLTTQARAVSNVKDSLRKFANDSGKNITDIVFSSNAGGIEYKFDDVGVAVWFTWDGETHGIGADRYDRTECNIQAIHHIIEGQRDIMRHGGLQMVKAAFRGYTALPAPQASSGHGCPLNTVHLPDHWQILGCRRTKSEAKIKDAYRRKAKTAHPDGGGSMKAFRVLQSARDAALNEAATIRSGESSR